MEAASFSDRDRHSAGAVGRARSLRQRATLPERLLWEELRRLKLNFRRQAPIGRYVVDFVHHGARLIVELDGPVHQLFGATDEAREAWLRSQGYRVLRFDNEQVIADAPGIACGLAELVQPASNSPLPLDGGEVGRGGVRAAVAEQAREAEDCASHAHSSRVLATPPTPALPPSRGKGDD